MFDWMSQWLGRVSSAFTKRSGLDSMDESSRMVLNQLQEASQLIRSNLRNKANFWKRQRRLPWAIVIFNNPDSILSLIESASIDYPIQRFAPKHPNPMSIILTREAAIILWPEQWDAGSPAWKTLGQWFSLRAQRSDLQSVMLACDNVMGTELATWAFERRHRLHVLSQALRYTPPVSLIVQQPQLVGLSAFVTYGTSPSLIARAVDGWSEDSFCIDWDTWLGTMESAHAYNALRLESSAHYQQLEAIDYGHNSQQIFKQLIRCLAEPNPYYPPIPVIEIMPLAASSVASQRWWDTIVWPRLRQARLSVPRMSTGALVFKCLMIAAAIGLTGVCLWQVQRSQGAYMTALQTELKPLTNTTDWLTAQTLRDTTQLIRFLDSPWGLTTLHRLWIALGQGLFLDTTEHARLQLKRVLWQRIDHSLLQPVGQQLERTLGQANASIIRKKSLSDDETRLLYNQLKLYMMLSDPQRVESAFMLAQTPPVWRQLLDQQNETLSNTLRDDAQTLLIKYSNALDDPMRPHYRARPELIATVQEQLKQLQKPGSAIDKIYADIRDKASAQFPAISIASIVGPDNARWFSGRAVVAGAFTRRAFETFIQPAFSKAAQGQLRVDDWVLGNSSSGQEQPISQDTQDTLLQLHTLYDHEFISQWLALIRQSDWINAEDGKQVNAALESLSVSQTSAYWLVFKSMLNESAGSKTHWIQAQLGKAKALIGTSPPSPEAGNTTAHPLGSTYQTLERWAGTDSTTATQYADLVAKLKQAWLDKHFNSQSPTDTRALVAGILANQPSEWTDLVKMIDQSMLKDTPAQTRDTFREVLLKPAVKTLGLMTRTTGQDLNTAWARDVLTPWNQLAQRYPLSDEGQDAGLSDLARFFKSKDGTLDRFIDRQLAPFVTQRHGGLTARTWNGIGLDFAPGYLDGISRLQSVASDTLNDSDTATFELRPIPTAGFADIQLDIDGQTLRYRNGPQSWKSFQWPGPGNGRGVRLYAQKNSGQTLTPALYTSRLGWLRLLNQAQQSKDGQSIVLSWVAESNAGEPVLLSFQYRHISGLDPLTLQTLKRTSLPARVIR